MPTNLLDYAEKNSSLYYHHQDYVTLEAFQNKKLSSNLKITSTCKNKLGYEFVNTVES